MIQIIEILACMAVWWQVASVNTGPPDPQVEDNTDFSKT